MKKNSRLFLAALLLISLSFCLSALAETQDKPKTAGHKVSRPTTVKPKVSTPKKATRVTGTAPANKIKISVKPGQSVSVPASGSSAGLKLGNSASQKESTKETGNLKGKPLYDDSRSVPFKLGGTDSSGKEQK